MTQPLTLSTAVRNLQIIVSALVMGALTFAVISVGLGDQFAQPIANLPVLSMAAVAMAMMNLAARFVVIRALDVRARSTLPQSSGRNQATDSIHSDWLAAYQNRTIVSAALFEGSLMFSLVAYMMEGQPAVLVVAGMFLLALLFHIPTAARVENWVRQQHEIRESDAFGTR